jgi:hypothetical protein
MLIMIGIVIIVVIMIRNKMMLNRVMEIVVTNVIEIVMMIRVIEGS